MRVEEGPHPLTPAQPTTEFVIENMDGVLSIRSLTRSEAKDAVVPGLVSFVRIGLGGRIVLSAECPELRTLEAA